MSNIVETPFEIEVFFDGGCPLCMREIRMLKRWDRRSKIRFTDIDAAEFQAAAVGKTQADLMAQIYGRLPDGNWIRGVEVFRRLYAAVGFGPVVFLTRLPVISQILDLGVKPDIFGFSCVQKLLVLSCRLCCHDWLC